MSPAELEDMPKLTVRMLDERTWPEFAKLVEANGGIWGGCWCQFGPPHELRNIKHRKQYEEGSGRLPDWRITCFFVGKGYRKRGVANLALRAALEEIGRLGGGVVEAYPEDVEGRKTSSSFLHGGTLAMFEREGFERVRRLGMHHWVVARVVPGSGPAC